MLFIKRIEKKPFTKRGGGKKPHDLINLQSLDLNTEWQILEKPLWSNRRKNKNKNKTVVILEWRG